MSQLERAARSLLDAHYTPEVRAARGDTGTVAVPLSALAALQAAVEAQAREVHTIGQWKSIPVPR